MISLDQFAVNQIMESLYEELHDPLPSPNYASWLPFESSGSSDFNSASCSFADVSFGRPIVAVTRGDVSVEMPQASSSFLSFDNQDSLHDPPQLCVNSAKGVVEPTNVIRSLIPRGSTWRENTRDFQRPERISMGSRPPSCAQDHVIAERKRRDRLKQQFLELSTIIPGLKKVQILFIPILHDLFCSHINSLWWPLTSQTHHFKLLWHKQIICIIFLPLICNYTKYMIWCSYCYSMIQCHLQIFGGITRVLALMQFSHLYLADWQGLAAWRCNQLH